MPNSNHEAVEKRVLEAEKVVVSDILNRWRRKHGMDYVLMVLNKPGDLFVRDRVSEDNSNEFLAAVHKLYQDTLLGTAPPKHSELMVIHGEKTEPIELLGCFYSFNPVKGQTVKDWCERWGYKLEGTNKGLKWLFRKAAQKTSMVVLSDLSMENTRIESIYDCFFE